MSLSPANQTRCSSVELLESGISLNDTLGAAFIGYSWACVVLGFLTTQVSNYYRRHASSDFMSLKILVGVLWSLELLHLILISQALYHYFISLFGSYLAIFTERIIWSLVTQVVVGVISSNILLHCESPTSSRRNNFITGTIALISLTEIGCIIVFVVQATMSILTLLLYAARPNTFQFIGVYFVLSKTFAVSFMCTLNTRRSNVDGAGVTDEPTVHIESSAFVIDAISSSRRTPYRYRQTYLSAGESTRNLTDRYHISSIVAGNKGPRLQEAISVENEQQPAGKIDE
ncbi:hypothetical protein BDP27DRAFT_1440723 [Rhodocollybia butyracea]|uniref:Uncharacterized protein n=1 Tax=Rhodocollybia butyracea TaxID=206335 RepID=A0A9P5P5G3_9AGAR|nr:hypothetical protein BDP27DRAFT_1440723 [Rhodocollybia butyracea]